MRVLWFSLSPSLYKNNSSYNGIGWIASLQKLVMANDDIKLAVSFIADDKSDKIVQDGVTYYPVRMYNNLIKKIDRFFSFEKYYDKELECFEKVINDFKPDVIHVFGSESCFGLLSQRVNVPIVLHIQGILNPCLNAWFPPEMNLYTFLTSQKFSPAKILKEYRMYQLNELMGKRESVIMKNCKNFLGRTDWDRRVSNLYSPGSKYFHVNEVLRDSFYNSEKWQIKERVEKIIVSTISSPPYKGADLILKTAYALSQFYNGKFQWKVFGVKGILLAEKITGIKASDVGVKVCGVVTEAQLAEELLAADVYFHPSYIDNSPNSVCEAQLLGLPVVATNVGGVGSLIDDNITGMLIPSNDPYTGASKIIELVESPELSEVISSASIDAAERRHDRTAIVSDLFEVYKQLS